MLVDFSDFVMFFDNQRPGKRLNIVKVLLKNEVLEFASGSCTQLPAASGSFRQLPEMGTGPRSRPTLPHAPGAKMT